MIKSHVVAPPWKNDEMVTECPLCERSFGLLVQSIIVELVEECSVASVGDTRFLSPDFAT